MTTPESPTGFWWKNPRLPLAVSLLSILISGFVAWYTLLRSVTLDVEIEEEVSVRNELGGTPDVNLTLTFWGDGPSGRKVTLSGIELRLTRLSGADSVTLKATPTRGEGSFPVIVEGQTGRSIPLSFTKRLYAPERIDQTDRWIELLKRELPGHATQLDTIRDWLTQRYLPPADAEGLTTYIDAGNFGTLNGQRLLPRRPESQLRGLIATLDPIRLKRVVFFVPGRYSGVLTVFGQHRSVIWRRSLTFEIEGTYAAALERDFNASLRVPLE